MDTLVQASRGVLEIVILREVLPTEESGFIVVRAADELTPPRNCFLTEPQGASRGFCLSGAITSL
jgi:hypothetical protein